MTQYPSQPSGGTDATSAPGGFDIAKIKQNALIACIVGFACGGVLPGILGLLGYLKGDTEPATAKKFTKWAWIAFAIMWGLTILFIIAYIIFIAVVVGASSTTTY